MYNIKVYNKISKAGLQQFDGSLFKVIREVSDDGHNSHAILLRSENLHNKKIADRVFAIARAGAGTNNIPIEECNKRGIVVFNTPGANANAVKELVLSAMLIVSRNIVEGVNFTRQTDTANVADNADFSSLMEAHKKQFSGSELRGKTLGIIGLGAIGAMVANMAEKLGMRVLGYDPKISIDAAWRLSSSVEKMPSMDALLGRADFVSLHVPAIKETHHLINERSLQKMKRSAVLLNFAREQIVDTTAIVKAIEAKHLAHYVTDFPTVEMLPYPEILAMPHIGASTAEAEENCAVMAVEQLIDFMINGNIVNSVNMPDISMPRVGCCRLVYSNYNIPNVISNVLTQINGINVLEMLNKSRGEIAFNLLDLEQKPTLSDLEKIKEIEGVIGYRLIEST